MNNNRWIRAEKSALLKFVNEYDWVFPGYACVADKVNEIFKNNRSAEACRCMDRRIAKDFKKHMK